MNLPADDKQLSPLKRAYRALETMQARLEALENRQSAPIAIIGMSCRFPGADSPESFWQLLTNGTHAVGEIPEGRWDVDALYDPDPEAEGKMYTRHGGFLSEVSEFDASFFGISPREAIHLDPQQRLLLEVTWEALQDAGAVQDRLTPQSTGVFIGITSTDYAQHAIHQRGHSDIDSYHITGNTLNAAAGRLSYCFGFQGPCVAIDTACSSSLSAMHQAIRALQFGECETALVGGVNLMLSPLTYIALSKTNVLSPSGTCRAFDTDADGMVRGEGCGVVLLKPLDAAQRDGDRILAVVRGSAVNQDGPSSGLTVPNGPAQESLIAQALANAHLTPEQVNYVEAHGTGTSLGDPIELRALASAYTASRPKDKPLWIGSVKTNIGHLEAAAGIAGIIKLVLMLKHRQRAPQLHFKTPTSRFDWGRHSIRVSTELEPWTSPEPIRCGVSSFGFSGMNAHVILEEAPTTPSPQRDVERPLDILALSAHNESTLRDMVTQVSTSLNQTTEEAWKDFCFSINAGRGNLDHRIALTADSAAGASQHLQQWLNSQKTNAVSSAVSDTSPTVAFLFTGQGAQYSGMGKQLYETHPVFKETLDRCDAVIQKQTGNSILAAIAAPDTSLLNRTDVTQPAVFALEYALASLWLSWGVTPSVMIGHSVGEYAAACLAGVFSLDDALMLISARGRLIHSAPGDGAMLVVVASVDEAKRLSFAEAGVDIAAINSPTQVVLSGEASAIQRLSAQCEREGIRSTRLQTSHAFHSSLMDPVLEPFAEFASTIQYSAPQLPIISCTTGEFSDTEFSNPQRWVDHIRKPVLFAQSVNTLQSMKPDILLEIGPKPVLTTLAQSNWPNSEVTTLPSLKSAGRDWNEMLHSLGVLFTQGVSVDWKAFDAPYPRRRVTSPRYPFQRQRFWITDGSSAQGSASQSSQPGDGTQVGVLLDAPGSNDIRYQAFVSLPQYPWLTDHRIYGQAVLPAAFVLDLILQATRHLSPGSWVEIKNFSFHAPCLLNDDSAIEIQVVLQPGDASAYALTVYMRDDSQTKSWSEYVSGTVTIRDHSSNMAVEDTAPLDAAPSDAATPCSIDDLYSNSKQRGVEFGPAFQSIKQVSCTETNAFSVIECPREVQSPKVFCLHPVLLDGCFQSLGALFMDQPNDALYLPVKIDRLCLRPCEDQTINSRVTDQTNPDDDMLVFDFSVTGVDQTPVAAITGMRFVEASPDQFRINRSVDTPAQYQLQWRETQPVSGNDMLLGRWVVCSPETTYTNALRDQVISSGSKCTACATEPEALAAHLPATDHLAFVVPPDDASLLSVDQSLEVVEAFLAVIKTWLSAASSDQHLWVLTHNAIHATESDSLSGVASSPLWGAVRSIQQEHPERSIHLLDCDDPAPQETISALMQASSLQASETQLAFRKTKCFVPRLVQATPSDVPLRLSHDKAYLVTGGTSGLGLRLAQWMANAGAGEIVLLSRSGVVASSDQPAIDEMQASGVEVRIETCDCSDADQLNTLVAQFESAAKPIAGIVHCAGVLDDSLIESQTTDRYRKVFAPKVCGALNLHQATKHLSLDFLVFFSSLSSVWGARGQSNYAAANAFLDAYAWSLRSKGVSALSINWGPWAEVGMAARENLLGDIAQQGILPMSPASACDAFAHAITSQYTQCAIASIDLSLMVQRLGGTVPPLLSELVQQPRSVVKPVASSRTVQLASSTNACDTSRIEETMQPFLVESISHILRIDPDALDVNASLSRLGVDSLMAVELRNQIRTQLDLDAPIAMFLDGSSTDVVAKRLLERWSERQTEVSDAPKGKSSEELSGDDAAKLLEQLDTLSDDEVDALLAKTVSPDTKD